jgi:glycosyltransferase involved in cell wall biosynthesis
MMKIIINTLSVTPRSVGIKTFLVNLVKHFLITDTDNEYILLCSPLNDELFRPFEQSASKLRIVQLPFKVSSPLLRILFDQVVVPLYIRKYEDAVLLTPSNIASLFSPKPQVLVVQTVASVKAIRQEVAYADKTVSRLQKIYFDTFLLPSMRRAERVVAVSLYLKDKLDTCYPSVKHKTVMVHEGVDVSHFAKALPVTSPEPPYVLFVSTLFPYKNVDLLLRAFAHLKGSDRSPEGLRLKIAGKDPDGLQRRYLEGLAAELDIARDTDFLGMVPYQDLPGLYQSAKLFVYPSSMESFGLPLIEAMSCGVPVISSNAMVLPEIVGEAGFVVNLDSPEGHSPEVLSQTMLRGLTDEPLRQQFIEQGLRRVEMFSWHTTARAITRLCEEVLSQRPLTERVSVKS